MSRVVSTTETVTLAMAESWLERNTNNRPLRDHHVRMLAGEMESGRWHLNGEAIVFDHDGNLIDGQHRLWAAFTSGKAFDSIIVRNVDPKAFATIDSGMKRSAGDALTKNGVKYGVHVAAILRLVHFVTTGARDHMAITKMSNAETLSLFDRYADVEEAACIVACSMLLRRLMPPTAMGALMYFARRHDNEKAMEFFDAITTGVNLQRGDARLTVRNYFVNRPPGQRPNARVQLAILIKAWNSWIAGRELSVVKFIEGEEFPTFAATPRHRRRVA